MVRFSQTPAFLGGPPVALPFGLGSFQARQDGSAQVFSPQGVLFAKLAAPSSPASAPTSAPSSGILSEDGIPEEGAGDGISSSSSAGRSPPERTQSQYGNQYGYGGASSAGSNGGTPPAQTSQNMTHASWGPLPYGNFWGGQSTAPDHSSAALHGHLESRPATDFVQQEIEIASGNLSSGSAAKVEQQEQGFRLKIVTRNLQFVPKEVDGVPQQPSQIQGSLKLHPLDGLREKFFPAPDRPRDELHHTVLVLQELGGHMAALEEAFPASVFRKIILPGWVSGNHTNSGWQDKHPLGHPVGVAVVFRKGAFRLVDSPIRADELERCGAKLPNGGGLVENFLERRLWEAMFYREDNRDRIHEACLRRRRDSLVN